MAQAQPQLLSILEKAANPISQLSMTIDLKGVYAPPQQWKLTDETNPGIFAYNIDILSKTFKTGKIQPRKLTEKQLKEQQQAKNKKAAKKQTKQEEKPIEEDPQAQKLRLQWEKLSQQQKFYRASQDPYKSFSLQFTDKLSESNLESDEIANLQGFINKGQAEIILTRKPDMNEEDLSKLKKSKPKNLNVGELYTAVYKGTINLLSLTSPGSQHLSQRVKLSFAGQVPADCIKIQLENTYIMMEIQLDKPLFPFVEKLKPEVKQLYPDFPNNNQKDISPVQKLKLEIIRAIKAISQQYTHCFSKQKQHQDDRKHSNLGSISTLRMNEITKKKDQFLNDFMNNGKYAILRDRISQIIKTICIDKFKKEKQKGKITKQTYNSTLSQLNLYFQEMFEQTLDEFMANESNVIHEDLVLGHENARHNRKQVIAPLLNQTQSERQLRLATESQVINKLEKAENHYLNLLVLKNEDINSLENYANFCLLHRKFETAYILYEKILKLSSDSSYKIVFSILLAQRRRVKDAVSLLESMIASEDSAVSDKIMFNLLLYFIFEREQDIKTSEKYLAIAEKYYHIKLNPNIKLNPIKNPYQQPLPKIPKPARYASQLSTEQTQEIRVNLIMMLANYHIYDLVEEFLPKISESLNKQILKIKVEVFKQDYDKALNLLDSLIEKNPKNLELLFSKAEICFKADKMFESQETFLTILKIKPQGNHIFTTYLRLGYTYLNRKSWEDAKSLLQKACEIKCSSSLSWIGLGIANLNIGNILAAQQALNLANIYDPLDKEAQRYLQRIKELNKEQNANKYKYINDL